MFNGTYDVADAVQRSYRRFTCKYTFLLHACGAGLITMAQKHTVVLFPHQQDCVYIANHPAKVK